MNTSEKLFRAYIFSDVLIKVRCALKTLTKTSEKMNISQQLLCNTITQGVCVTNVWLLYSTKMIHSIIVLQMES